MNHKNVLDEEFLLGLSMIDVHFFKEIYLFKKYIYDEINNNEINNDEYKIDFENQVFKIYLQNTII